jgi:uroporphyrinogen-III synthase
MLLITRPDADAHTFAAACAARGITTHLEPLLTITPSPLSEAAATAAAQADALILTSRNALPSLASLHRHPLICVGEDTARLARASGFAGAVCGGETAAGLAATLTTRPFRWLRLFYARGTETAFPLTDHLRAVGLTVSEAVTYTAAPRTAFTAQTATLLTTGTLTAVSLFSARTAQIFADLLSSAPPPRPLRAFCLSAATAAPLCQHPLFSVHTAAAPTAAALLNLIDSPVNSR